MTSRSRPPGSLSFVTVGRRERTKILVIQVEVECGGSKELRCTRAITLAYFVTADNWTCSLIPPARCYSAFIRRDFQILRRIGDRSAARAMFRPLYSSSHLALAFTRFFFLRRKCNFYQIKRVSTFYFAYVRFARYVQS